MQTAVAAVAAMLLSAGPAAAPPEPPLPPAGLAPSQASSADVSVKDNSFDPRQVTVKAGSTVSWAQTGANLHSVSADDGSFDSHASCPPACMRSGDTFRWTFDKAGRYPYRCKLHGQPGGAGMSGVVVVEGAAPAASQNRGQGAQASAANTNQGAARPAVVAGVQTEAQAEPLARTGGGGVATMLGIAMAAGALGLQRAVRS